MKEKEKAVELVERFKPNVNPYVGSGMLSNTYDDGAILYQAKQCALICVERQMSVLEEFAGTSQGARARELRAELYRVKQEIEKL